MLTGRVLDRTTGQALAHVRVSGAGVRSTTDSAGRYTLRGIEPGSVRITLESDDVPAQRFTITVHGGKMQRDFTACSTTLDYDCGGPALPNSPGSGAS